MPKKMFKDFVYLLVRFHVNEGKGFSDIKNERNFVEKNSKRNEFFLVGCEQL